jgi:tetratricopeptide (TPR) repeat protein
MVIPDPLSPDEHLQLGLAYEKAGDLDLALREYEAAGPLPLALLGRGNVHFQQGRHRKAEAFYRSLLSGDLMPEAANNLAFMLVLENRDPEEAYRLASRAVEEAIKRNLDEEQVRNFKNTLNQAETALMHGREGKGSRGAAAGPAAEPEPEPEPEPGREPGDGTEPGPEPAAAAPAAWPPSEAGAEGPEGAAGPKEPGESRKSEAAGPDAASRKASGAGAGLKPGPGTGGPSAAGNGRAG